MNYGAAVWAKSDRKNQVDGGACLAASKQPNFCPWVLRNLAHFLCAGEIRGKQFCADKLHLQVIGRLLRIGLVRRAWLEIRAMTNWFTKGGAIRVQAVADK